MKPQCIFDEEDNLWCSDTIICFLCDQSMHAVPERRRAHLFDAIFVQKPGENKPGEIENIYLPVKRLKNQGRWN